MESSLRKCVVLTTFLNHWNQLSQNKLNIGEKLKNINLNEKRKPQNIDKNLSLNTSDKSERQQSVSFSEFQ